VSIIFYYSVGTRQINHLITVWRHWN